MANRRVWGFRFLGLEGGFRGLRVLGSRVLANDYRGLHIY